MKTLLIAVTLISTGCAISRPTLPLEGTMAYSHAVIKGEIEYPQYGISEYERRINEKLKKRGK